MVVEGGGGMVGMRVVGCGVDVGGWVLGRCVDVGI